MNKRKLKNIAPEYDCEISCVIAITESGVIDNEWSSICLLSVFINDIGVGVSTNDGDVVWFDNQTRTLLNFFTSDILTISLKDDSRWAK